MQSSWVKYAEILESNGRYNIASILRISTPVLIDNLITTLFQMKQQELRLKKK